jgi:hypothetical protein
VTSWTAAVPAAGARIGRLRGHPAGFRAVSRAAGTAAVQEEAAVRVDVCPREDYATQAALLEALAAAGAHPDDDFDLEVPLPTGLLRFRAGTDILTVLADAWAVDLEGPDGLVRRVLEGMTGAGG